MLKYATTPNIFSYEETITETLRNLSTEAKEYFVKRGSATHLPNALKYLSFYATTENVLTFIPHVEPIKRSTELHYYFQGLISKTTPLAQLKTVGTNVISFGISYAHIEAINPKAIFSIRIIPVVGQIQDTFERAIPEWARQCEATEALNVSLALKLSPKHRVRVYKRDEHIIVFTTKGYDDEYVDDYILQRKLWACIPLLRGWTETPELKKEYATLINLYKNLANQDATEYWTLLETAYNTSNAIKDLKYSGITQAFNNIKTLRIETYNHIANDERINAERFASDYAKALARKRDAERNILEIQQSETGLDSECIKRIVDKKICYNLNTNRLTGPNATLAYRCSAPLLAYDKDAALVCYNKRIKGNYSSKLKNLFKLLFVDEKVILNFDEAIDISLNNGTIQAKGGYTQISTDFNKYVPNPHHYYYNCWGSYRTIISKLIQEYKLEELFYQIKAAVGSFNFTDYPVLSKLLQHLASLVEEDYRPHCFYWKDEGCTTLHTYAETLEHFKQEGSE